MREKNVFEKNILENLTSSGVNSGVTHVSRQFLALSTKQKQKFKKNWFENVVLDLWLNGFVSP